MKSRVARGPRCSRCARETSSRRRRRCRRFSGHIWRLVLPKPFVIRLEKTVKPISRPKALLVIFLMSMLLETMALSKTEKLKTKMEKQKARNSASFFGALQQKDREDGQKTSSSDARSPVRSVLAPFVAMPFATLLASLLIFSEPFQITRRNRPLPWIGY